MNNEGSEVHGRVSDRKKEKGNRRPQGYAEVRGANCIQKGKKGKRIETKKKKKKKKISRPPQTTSSAIGPFFWRSFGGKTRGAIMTMSSYEIRNEDGTHNTEKVAKLVVEINSQVALFRDLLICVGQTRDGPELRERIRKVRRQCVDTCKHASQLLLPGIKNDVAEGIPVDNQNFVHLVACTQLMSRELRKCKRLVQTLPVDMTEYYENKPGPSGMGGLGVISQLLLCKTLQPDFQQEEICSIEKDSDDILAILKEMQEYMPQEEAGTRNLALTGEDMFSLWSKKRTRRSLYRNMSSLCCTCKPAYL